jgi:hypothetical protein
MSEARLSEPLHIDERLIVLVGYLLTSAMMTCLTASFVQLGELAAPGWDGSYLYVLGFLVALEATYSHRALRTRYFTDPKWIVFRFSELILILATLKAAQILTTEGRSLWTGLSLWQQDLGANFFDNETIYGIVTLAFVWVLSGQFAGELIALEANQFVLRQEAESGIYEDRNAIRKRLSNLILLVGAGMVVFTAMLRIEGLAGWMDLPPLRASVYNTIFYFFLGLVLLSLTQFNLMRARWLRDSLPVRVEIAGRWILYSAVFILALALIAALLPTSYSIDLLSVLNYIFFVLTAIFNLLIMLILTPIFWLFGWLMSLFQGEAQVSQTEMLPPVNDIPLTPQTGPIPWLELLKSIAFWSVFLGVISFALVFYLRENRELWEKLRRIPFFAALARFSNWLGGLLRGVNRQLGTALEAGLGRLRAMRRGRPAAQPWRYLSLRRLPPRERVRFYYLALVRRGSERGYARRPAQTPFEYSQDLSEGIGARERQRPSIPAEIEGGRPPDGDLLSGDVVLMTAKFIEARYSRHEITPQDAGLVRRAWARVRSALRGPRPRKE